MSSPPAWQERGSGKACRVWVPFTWGPGWSWYLEGVRWQHRGKAGVSPALRSLPGCPTGAVGECSGLARQGSPQTPLQCNWYPCSVLARNLVPSPDAVVPAPEPPLQGILASISPQVRSPSSHHPPVFLRLSQIGLQSSKTQKP